MQKNEEWGKISGFLDKDTEFTGEISFSNSIRIDGKFKGKIVSGASLIVGENGRVDADVDVNTISVNGSLNGTLKASEKIEIFSKGKVTGKLITPKLIIEEGAYFQGSSQMSVKNSDKKLIAPEKIEEKETDKKI